MERGVPRLVVSFLFRIPFLCLNAHGIWYLVAGQSKIAAALAVAAAGFGGGLAYKKFKTYLRAKQLRKGRKERRRRDASAAEQEQKVRAVRNGAACNGSETATQTQATRDEIDSIRSTLQKPVPSAGFRAKQKPSRGEA